MKRSGTASQSQERVQAEAHARQRSQAEQARRQQEGRWGYILAWLVGIPIPILLLVYLLRGCS